ncbi:MAG: aldehyde dehydrogenase family protein, partial [Betaproteobacteria bacterium]
MSASSPMASAATPIAPSSELERLFAIQRTAFESERYSDHAKRQDLLRRMLTLTVAHEQEWVDAIAADFGHRSAHETRLAECYVVAAAARHALTHLAQWMKPRRVRTPLHLQPARAYLLRQPVGVVGIISPWNYPLQLALAPALAALAAGNRVLLKPSELTPALAALMAQKVRAYFSEDELAVVPGDAGVGQAFTTMRFDHLFFTGSTAVGRLVARAAAENLTPVTLELGGKSPALFDTDAQFAVAAPRLMAGKLLNAGQTCIAPDYALVQVEQRASFVEAVSAATSALYPTISGNDDYTAIVNDRHYHRLQRLVADARQKGAAVITLSPPGETPPERTRKFPPTLLVGVDDSMAVMQEEIFGPVLPIETYDTIDEALRRINARPRPLAFYYFGNNAARRRHVLEQTIAGGVTVNDTMWHFAHEGLPFG